MKYAATTQPISRFLRTFLTATETETMPLPTTMPGADAPDNCPACGEPLSKDEIADGMCWTCLQPLKPEKEG